MGNMLESESSGSEKDDNNSENETRTEADGMESSVQDNNATTSSSSAHAKETLQPTLDSIGPLRRLNSESSVTKTLMDNNMDDIKKWCSTKTSTATTTITKQSPKQLPPRENLIALKPKSAKSIENSNKIVPNSNKQKEPKFIPYEPYKGAVRAMTENSVQTHSRKASYGSSIASGGSSSQLNAMVNSSSNDNSSVSLNKQGENSSSTNLNTRKSFSNREEDDIPKSSFHHQNIDSSTTTNNNLNINNSYNNNSLDLELSASSLLVLKERLKIYEKDINELQVENTRLKKMLVDSMSGFGSPSKTSEMLHHHTPKCQLNPEGCNSMSESVDNLTDEIEVWRSKFLSTCVLVEQVTKQNQDWKKGIISAATLFRELKQRSEVLTPDLFDKINSWLASNNNSNSNSVRHHTDNVDSAHSRSSSITYAHDISKNDEPHPTRFS